MHICIVKKHLIWLKSFVSYEKNYLLELYIYYIYNYFVNTCHIKYMLIFFAHTFVSLHFYKYQYCLWTFSKQKIILWLSASPQIHSQWFRWLSTFNLAILHSMLNNFETPSYSATYTFSPTTVSLQHLFSTEHFFNIYSVFIPLRRKYWNGSENGFRVIDWLNEDKY